MPELGKATYVVEIDSREFERDLDKLDKRTRKSTADQEREINKVGDAWDGVGDDVDHSTDRVEEHGKTTRKVTVTSTKDVDKHRSAWDRLTNSLGRVAAAGLGLGALVKVIKFPALIAGAGAATQALSALAGGATALVGSLAGATGAIVAMTLALGPLAGGLASAAAGYTMLGQAMLAIKLAQFKDISAAMAGNEEAMANLGPAAQKFVGQLKSLEPAVESLRKVVQEPLFEGLGDGLEKAKRNIGPLRKVLAGTGQALGSGARQLGGLLGSKAFGEDFEKIGRTNNLMLTRLGGTVTNLASALRHVLVVARPLNRWISKLTLRWSENLEASAAAGRESGRTARFFERTRRVVKVLGDSLGNVWGMLKNIGSASFGTGMGLWKDFEKWTQKLENWTGSKEGQNSLEKFFKRGARSLYLLIDAIGPAFKGLSRILGLGQKTGNTLLKDIGQAARNFEAWTKSTEGTNSIKEYFKEIIPPLRAAGRLVRDVFTGLVSMGGKNADVTTDLLEQFRVELLPKIFTLLEDTTRRLGPNLIDLLTEVADTFIALSGASSPLIVTLDVLTFFLEGVNKLLENRVIRSFVVWTFVGIGVTKALTGIVTLMKWIVGSTFVSTLGKIALKFGPVETAALHALEAFDKLKTKSAELAKRGLSAAADWAGGVMSGLRSRGKRVWEIIKGWFTRSAGITATSTAAGEVGGQAATSLMDKLRARGRSMSQRVGTMLGSRMGKFFVAGLVTFGLIEFGPELIKFFSRQFKLFKRQGLNFGQLFMDAFNEGLKNIGLEIPWPEWMKESIPNLPGDEDAPSFVDVAKDSIGRGFKQAIGLGGGQEGGMVTPAGIVPFSGFQAGGVVGGKPQPPGPKDTVPAMLQPGELVLPVKAVKSMRRGAGGAADIVEKFRKQHNKNFERITKKTDDESEKARKGLLKNYGIAEKDGNKLITKLKDGTVKSIQRARESAIGNADSMRAGVSGSYNSMASAGKKAIQELGDATNKALDALGVKSVNFGVSTGSTDSSGGAQKKQRGGAITPVPGRGSGDKVPALLEPGEVVLNREAVRAAGGPHAANLANREFPRHGVRRYKTGSVVEALGPYDVPPFTYAADHAGGNSHWHIAMATPGQVVAVGKRLQAMGFMVGEHPAFGGVNAQHAPGGYHYTAQAIDVNSAADETLAETKRVAALLGGNIAGGAFGTVKQLKKKIITGPEGPLRAMAQAAVDKVLKAANAHLGKQTMEGAEYMPGGGGPVVAQMARILLGHGFSNAGAAGIIGNAYRESLWDPGAVGTGGGGLFGFTTSPVSLADLQNYAQKQGRPWTDVGTQMQFMLASPGGGGLVTDSYYNGLEAFLKKTSDVHDATYRFMNEWERPGIPAFEDRLAGAQKAYQTIQGLAGGRGAGRMGRGGKVPGPLGAPRAAIVHGGEQISRPHEGLVARGHASPGRSGGSGKISGRMRIDNWRDGTAYFEGIAEDVAEDVASDIGHMRRMG